MSVCGQNGQTDDENASEDVVAPVRDIYKQKPVSKVVRVLTVLAYLLSVSLAAILLSVYYVCVWKSPELPLLNGTGELSARLVSLNNHTDIIDKLNYTGGGRTSVSAAITEPSTNKNSTENNTNTTVVSILDSSKSANDTTVFSGSTQEEPHSKSILNHTDTFNFTDNVT